MCHYNYQTVSGPYIFEQDDLDTYASCEQEDVGRFYLVVTGCLFFYDSEQEARDAKDRLNDDGVCYE